MAEPPLAEPPSGGVTDPSSPGLSTLPDVTQSTFDYTPTAMAGYVGGVAVVAWLFRGIAPPSLVLPWLAVFALLVGLRFVLWAAFRRAAARGSGVDWARWLARSNAGTLAAAAFWGATGWLFHVHGGALQQTGLILIVYTFCVVGIPVLAIQPRVYLAFAALVFLPLVVRIGGVGDRYHYELAGELLLIMSLTIVLAGTYRQALQRAIELKLKSDHLTAQLRVEKLAADAARHEAEVANRAKTQFFAAASHDLRQPLHAMGLFAEALRQRVREPEVARLVNSINESVDALEGLFSELLDITRIDAGGVEVHAESFALADILRKIRLHFEPAAFEKGLSLRLRGGHRVAHADPLLVERVLRNLVANAIRYTDDGSVLVACRRRGDRLLLQVWDTGRGIAPADQRRVFEEFFQVPQAAVAPPDERKGLGLGLSIVKRLAELMHAPLALASRPGRGSVFTLELLPGKLPRARPTEVAAKAPAGITLAGRLIVVVEDEPAVRAGLEVLLQGWGATLATFDSAAAAMRWAATTADAGGAAPDLLVVDYRLEDGRSGVDAIVALRRSFRADLPAIVVTGSTMTGHDREAQQHDFHLLIKPVLPNRLRAMIGFKLGSKEQSLTAEAQRTQRNAD